MFKNIKIKRNFKFEKIRRYMIITDDVCEYTQVSDSALLNFAMAAAARNDSTISNYTSESNLTSDTSCLTIYGTKANFITIVNELLKRFGDYITVCQF